MAIGSALRFSGLLALALLGPGLPASPAAAGEMVFIDCYPEAEDDDGDGYAKKYTPATQMRVPEEQKLSCPDDWVAKEGDCDDSLDFVHPNAPEIAFNLRDDNCQGGMDEPQLVYLTNGNQNTKTSFSIRVKAGHWALTAQGSSLAYRIEYADLAASALVLYTPYRLVGALPSDSVFDAPLAGLAPARVYHAKVHFYKATTTTAVILGRPSRRTTYTSLGISTDWYFSTTDGEGDLEEARSDLVLDGFYELSESDRGRVGYRGTAKRDGTRYGAAAKERWCSEFYVWLARSRFWQIAYASNVPGIVSWFSLYREYHPHFPFTTELAEVAERADYVAIDEDGDGDADHSTMFLAYDLTTGKVWTLEGNKGNYVRVKERVPDLEIRGLGHLTDVALALSF
jgi:hypothetical protein